MNVCTFLDIAHRFCKSYATVEPNISLYFWLNMQLRDCMCMAWLWNIISCLYLDFIEQYIWPWITTSNMSWYIGLHMYPNIKLQCFYYHFILQAAVWWHCWFLFCFVLETWLSDPIRWQGGIYHPWHQTPELPGSNSSTSHGKKVDSSFEVNTVSLAQIPDMFNAWSLLFCNLHCVCLYVELLVPLMTHKQGKPSQNAFKHKHNHITTFHSKGHETI